MTPAQINQALKIRMLKADLTARALSKARREESLAISAVQDVEARLTEFDETFEQRLIAFQKRTSTGITPESLHSARTFHVDLSRERAGIETLVSQAWGIVDVARREVAAARLAWVSADRSADNMRVLEREMTTRVRRREERVAEHDADELSLARGYRNGR